MDKLRVWVQRASEDNYTFISTKNIQELTKEELMDFLLTGLRAGDKFMLKPGNEDIDVSIYYYDFLT